MTNGTAPDLSLKDRASSDRPEGSGVDTLGTGPNAVVLALVVAILELEQRRDRGMVVTPMSRRRPE